MAAAFGRSKFLVSPDHRPPLFEAISSMATASASLAKLIDLGLHHPTLTDAQLRAGCEKAKK